MSDTFKSNQAAWRRAKQLINRPLEPVYRTVWFNGVPKKVWILLVPLPYKPG